MSTTDDPVVTLLPSGRQFICHPHASILESGLSAGVALPFRCHNGSCGECRARVVSGEIETSGFHDYALTEAEKTSGVVLLCSHRALTPIEIEVTEATVAQDIPRQKLNTRICHKEYINDVLIVRVKILRGKALWYLAGQYASIHLPGIQPWLQPIATCPCEAGYLEFHFPSTQADVRNAIEQLQKRERIVIEGPYGEFTFEDATLEKYHHVFIAVDDHFAVIKPMIDHIMATELEPQCTLLWVSGNHYKHNLCRSWDDAFDWLSYHALPDIAALNESIIKVHQQSCKPLKVYLSAPHTHQSAVETQLLSTSITEIHTDSTVIQDS